MARAQNPERHLGSSGRDCLDALAGGNGGEIGLKFKDVLGEIVGAFRSAPQSADGQLVGSRCAAEPEVDSARKQPLERTELFGDDVRGVVWQHDTSRPDPDGVGSASDMGKNNRCGGTGDTGHVVMLGYPHAVISPAFSMGGQV